MGGSVEGVEEYAGNLKFSSLPLHRQPQFESFPSGQGSSPHSLLMSVFRREARCEKDAFCQKAFV